MKQRPTLVETGNYVEGSHIVEVSNDAYNLIVDIGLICEDYNRWQINTKEDIHIRDGYIISMSEEQAEALRDALTVHLRRLRAEERKLRQSQEEA